MHKSAARRRPTVFVQLCVAVHVLCLLAVVITPALWRWLLAIVLVNHGLIALIGLWPRSRWLGPNWTALPAAAAARNEIALTIDDGPDPVVTPQVLDLLARHRVKATFFCVGRKAQLYPELCRDIVRRGHAVENHSQRHWHNFSLLGPAGYEREIEAAQASLGAITGQRPQFFRAPAGLRNPFLAPVLARLGLQLASWSVRGFDTRINDAARISKRLLRGMHPGSILLLHDGNAAQTANGIPVIVAVLPAVIAHAAARNLHFVTLREAAYEHNPVALDI